MLESLCLMLLRPIQLTETNGMDEHASQKLMNTHAKKIQHKEFKQRILEKVIPMYWQKILNREKRMGKYDK